MNARDVISVVTTCVNEAVAQAHLLFSANQAEFVVFLDRLQTTLQPRHLTTSEGLDTIKQMLSSEVERDWLVTLDMLIHVRIADQYILYKSLLETLACAMSNGGFVGNAAGVNKPQVLFEDEYISRQKTVRQNSELLEGNKLLVSIYCILMFARKQYHIVERKAGNNMVQVVEIMPTRSEIIAVLAAAGASDAKQ